MSAAIAVFVKTPGLSPVKTRLAAAIGTDAALRVYRASIACVAESIRHTSLQPYWAVAEPDGTSHWGEWPVVLQSEGDLGARMRSVYQRLIQAHPAVILIGADAPAVSTELLMAAAASLDGPAQRVVAPASDGGFVLFGANVDLAHGRWSAVPYGAPDTMRQFLDQVGRELPVHTLAVQQDLDTQADLAVLAQCPPAQPNAAQRAFWQLARSLHHLSAAVCGRPDVQSTDTSCQYGNKTADKRTLT